MSNKLFFVQLLAVIVCSFLFAYFFASDRNKKAKDFRKETRYEISVLQKQVKEAQNDINKVLRDINMVLRIYTSLETQENVQDPSNYQPEDLTEQLNEIWEKTTAFEKTMTRLSRRLQKIENTGQGARAENRVWFNYLTEEKRKIVQEIYQQELAVMREKISLSPGDTAPDAEEMMQAIQESREILKERLKDVLNEEEYQSFQESLDSSPLPPVPEPIQ